MDYAKIAYMLYAHKDKVINGLFRLHVSITRTLPNFLFKICVVGVCAVKICAVEVCAVKICSKRSN